MNILGNIYSQKQVKDLLQPNEHGPSVICLVGPPHIGKSSFIKSIIPEFVQDVDFLEVESTIDSIRNIVEFCHTSPHQSPYKLIFIPDVDKLSLAGQDACLKITESPPKNLKILLTSSNLESCQDALVSRIRNLIRWTNLSKNDLMVSGDSLPFDDFSYNASFGCFGLYEVILKDRRFREFYELLIEFINGVELITRKLPEIISDIKTDINRDAFISVVRYSVREGLKLFGSSKNVNALSNFHSTLENCSSANVELHFYAMISTSLV